MAAKPKPNTRLMVARQSWAENRTGHVLGVERGAVVHAWIDFRTLEGWIYAECQHDLTLAGWLPYAILEDTESQAERQPEPHRKRLRANTDWHGIATSNVLDVHKDSCVLVWTGSETEHGWIYAERESDRTCAGWLPFAILEELESGYPNHVAGSPTPAGSVKSSGSAFECNAFGEVLPPLVVDTLVNTRGSLFRSSNYSDRVQPLNGFGGFSGLLQQALKLVHSTRSSADSFLVPNATDSPATTASGGPMSAPVALQLPDGRAWDYPLDRAELRTRASILEQRALGACPQQSSIYI